VTVAATGGMGVATAAKWGNPCQGITKPSCRWEFPNRDFPALPWCCGYRELHLAVLIEIRHLLHAALREAVAIHSLGQDIHLWTHKTREVLIESVL
jgi:hypothetical protein